MIKKPDKPTKTTALRRQAEKLLRSTDCGVAAMPVKDVQQLVHELQVHQIELEMQNEELRRAQVEIEAARDRYADLYDFSPAGHLTLDTHSKIVEANLRAGTLLGVNRNKLIGQPLARFIAPSDAATFHRHCQEVLKTGLRQTCELRLVKEASGSRWVYLESLAVHEEAKPIPGWQTTLLDISDRKRAEQQLENQQGQLIRNITELKQAEVSLQASEQRIRLTTEATEVGIWEWNVLTNHIRWDAQMFRLYGIAPTPDGSVQYATWSGAVLPEDLSEQEAILRDTIRQIGRSARAFRIRRVDNGECRYIKSVEAVRTNAQGQVEWVVGTNHDVTEREVAEKQVRQLNSELELRVIQRTAELEGKAAELAQASHYKSEFLANMSHELRTPLNSVLILSRTLAENKPRNLTEQQIEWARTIQGSGVDLLKLIDEVLDLSKVEVGKMELVLEDAPLAELCDLTERSFRPVAEERKLGFTLTLDPQVPKRLRTDMHRLRQILKNLLANAFKFTQAGEVAVSIAPAVNGWPLGHERLDRAPRVLAFIVRDTGIGIPPDKQELIFDAFRQAESGTARTYGGTGLGLAISRDIAHLLGGTISVKSTPGMGSTFILYLPDEVTSTELPDETALFAPSADAALSADRQAVSHSDSNEVLRGRTVLVVDDDARNIFALTSLLENQDMTVLTATNGRTAIDLIQHTQDLDSVLMDIMMPEMAGYETVREIRNEIKLLAKTVASAAARDTVGSDE